MGVILAGAFWGALAGGLIGGAVGGIAAAINGGSFLEGFADGALSGAISGAVTGAACAGLGALGAAAGKGIQCMSTVGKAINVTSKVTAALSFGMDGFDMLAMGVSLFDPSNALVEFNQKLHSNALYNGFQIAVNALAVFSAGAASTMKCFVAGTMILTVAGLVAIENIKAGDKVIATNPETFEVAEKTVLETYVRETTELLHLRIGGEVIKTTVDHPFYVKDVGFVEAVNLQVGDKLVDSRGNVLVVEEKKLEITGEPVKVYNFKVDDFHTYHVGNKGILVHNANKYVKGTRSTQLTFDEALKKLDKSGLRPGQTEISKSRVMEIVENYDPMKAQSSVYTDSTGRYLVEGHHTTVANTMLGKGSGVNMNIPTQQIPSATNVYWTKKWYEFWKTQIKVTK